MTGVVKTFLQAKRAYEENGGRGYDPTRFVCSRDHWQSLWREVRETCLDRAAIPIEAPEDPGNFLLFGSRLRVDDAMGDSVIVEPRTED